MVFWQSLLSLYLLAEFAIWLHRAVTMIPSMRRYSVLLKSPPSSQATLPKVSMIIPCRNEEANLPRLLPTLHHQQFPNLEIILIDDRSEDGTLRLLEEGRSRDGRIKVVRGKVKPREWTGKAHALQQGVEAATGEWFLFSDADTQHEPDSVSRSVAHALQHKIDFLTLTSQYLCESFAEYLIQPMAIGCFAVWFKLQDVNDPKSRVPLACGHYILIRRAAYEALGGFDAIKHEVLEDLALFKRAKKDGRFKFELAIGSDLFKTRMYSSFKSAWLGWRRIFMHSLDRRLSVFIAKICALLVNSFLPFALLALTALAGLKDPGWFALSAGSAALCAFIVFLRIQSHKSIKAPASQAILHPVSSLILAGILVDCVYHLLAEKKVEWKGEKY